MGIPALTQPKRTILPTDSGYDSTDPGGDGGLRIVGEIENGSPLVIHGPIGFFGTKEQQSVPVFDQFNYTDGELLEAENPLWESYSLHEGALVTSDLSRTGGNAAINTSERDGFDTNHVSFPASREAFVSYWFYFEADVNGGEGSDYAVGKLCRFTSSTASGGGGVYNGKGMVSITNMNPRAGGGSAFIFDTGASQERLDYFDVPFNQWVRINMYARHSTVNNDDARAWAQAVGFTNKSFDGFSTAVPDESSVFDTLLLGVMMANVQGDGMRMLIDEVYVDRGQNSLARIELCESTTWSDNAQKEIQPYSAWDDNSITITQNHGNLSGECGLFFVPEVGDPILIAALYIGGE